ncbi:hypothetical protein HOLleu_39477 [Holothuria leucospilota]|uniref:Uncharacterized protein n=1 Tax=Holothuria leucospilota TaxID=206669 RepID=A0A9Q1BCZ7_HOLLE|nr:hypothetical protein HOLleu_39477 [Holothuria leucospilota]
MIQLPYSNLPHVTYNVSYQGEVLVTSLTFTDYTLAAELSKQLKEQVSTSFQIFSVFFPLVIGMTEEHVLLNLRHFTNSTKKVTYFYGTSTSDVTQVDSIEEGKDGIVTFRLGDDVMVYQAQDEVKCNGETKVGKDFDEVNGKVIKITNYPLSFDWGCEFLGSQISFCKLLDGFRCELARVRGDVCIVTLPTLSTRCPATMKIVNMTGVFREMIPFLAETGPIFCIAKRSQQRILPDLRRTKIKGFGGRFVVNRDALEQEIQRRKQQDGVCGQDVMIQLPQSLPHVAYNESYQGEVLLTSLTITDNTLAAELSDELKEQVSTSYQIFSVFLPVVTGMTEKHAMLNLRHFTNSTKKVTYCFGTSTTGFTQVDSIEQGNDGLVTFRLGDDVMIYQAQDEGKCNGETEVGKDFDKVSGKIVTITNYPLSFDWGCELVGSQISFCKLLDGFRCELARVGGDVCTVTSTILSERYPATMKIVNMTGVFREMIPFLAETIPNESFETEFVDRQHSTGIVYPCLTP